VQIKNLHIILFTLIFSLVARAENYPELHVHLWSKPVHYYQNQYGYDNIQLPCTGNFCIPTFLNGKPVQIRVGCSRYEYLPGGAPGTKLQVCHISSLNNGGNIKPVDENQNYTIVTGFIDEANKYHNNVPQREVFLSDLKGHVIKFAPQLGTGKPGTEVPEPEITEGGISKCKVNCPGVNVVGLERIPQNKIPKVKPVNQACSKYQSDEACQLCNCYHESRGEPLNGKIGVIRAVLARLNDKSFPGSRSACGVVFASAQFSWTSDRINNNISTSDPDSVQAFEDCKEALSTAKKRGSGTPYFYNPDKARPKWARNMKTCATIGNHRFVVPQNMSCPANLTGKT
jgi:N-acetylmuramoyl-L-alanine amidase